MRSMSSQSFHSYIDESIGIYVLFTLEPIPTIDVQMSAKKDSTIDLAKDSIKWTKYCETYDPIRIGSIDGIESHNNISY